jgi:hypothetical protein
VYVGLGLATLSLFVFSCSRESASGPGGLSTQEVRQIAKDAYIYGFPWLPITRRSTSRCWIRPVPTTGHHSTRSQVWRMWRRQKTRSLSHLTLDTAYSFLWMDLRAEPIVVAMPKIEKRRYYSGQLLDLYTFNFAYIGTRTYGNDGGDFLVVGPGWSGV